MQSFFQYRGFRAAVEAQLDRDRAKAQGFQRHDQSVAADSGSPSSATSDGSKVDLEKGGESGEGGVFRLPSGVKLGDIDPEERNPGPSDEAARLEEDQNPEEHREAVEEKIRQDREDHEEEEEEQDDDDYELGLNARQTLSRTTTQQSVATRLGQVLTGIEVRRRTTREGGEGNVFVVGYEGADDPNDPHNWSFLTRIGCTINIAAIGCVVGFASAVDSSFLPQAAKEFGVSEVVESLATALFLAGFGIGGLLAGPVSETVGRNPVYIGTMGLYMVFVMASALAPNIEAQLVFRFIAGLFGSTRKFPAYNPLLRHATHK